MKTSIYEEIADITRDALRKQEQESVELAGTLHCQVLNGIREQAGEGKTQFCWRPATTNKTAVGLVVTYLKNERFNVATDNIGGFYDISWKPSECVEAG